MSVLKMFFFFFSLTSLGCHHDPNILDEKDIQKEDTGDTGETEDVVES